MDYKDIEPQLAGMWQVIMEDFGIEFPRWQGKNTKNCECPLCGGSDRAHFRMTEGRISLFCRHCAAAPMKSAEQVIMEYAGLSFYDLVQELEKYAYNVDHKVAATARKRVKATPKTNMPTDHKQVMPDEVDALLDKLDLLEMHPFLARHSVQYPSAFHATEKAMYFPVCNEAGAQINVAKIYDENGLKLAWLAKGASYLAWHSIPACEVRETAGIAYSVSLIKGLRHWWKTGQEVRIMFDFAVMLHAVNVGFITKSDTLICDDWQREQLPIFE